MSEKTVLIVRRLLAQKGATQDTLAGELKVHQSTVNRWKLGSEPKGFHYEKLMTLARKKGILNPGRRDLGNSDALLFLKEIPLSGYVGAGAAVLKIAHDTVSDTVETVDVPLAFGEVSAFRVRGDSMYPAYRDGDILCISSQHEGPEQLIGRECLVITTKDEWLIKVIERGSSPGQYNLISHNSAPIRDVEISDASPVRYVLKR